MTDRITIVGILNVTPDSFFDGGKYKTIVDVMKHAETMIADGADILEIGGESSGPSSEDVSSEEELRRVLPVIEALRLRFPSTRLAVDTTKAIVAKEALLRGVCMINDVTAGRSDPHILHVCAEYACDCVLMYSKNNSPRTTIEQKMYTDIIATIHSFFEERIESAVIAGIARENIIVDPGLGHFLSSDPQYSFEVLKQLSRFSDLGSVFISPSRKSFLAGPRNLPANERLPATLAATMLALQNGASFIRTHDVAETREVVEVWGKISDEREASS